MAGAARVARAQEGAALLGDAAAEAARVSASPLPGGSVGGYGVAADRPLPPAPKAAPVGASGAALVPAACAVADQEDRAAPAAEAGPASALAVLGPRALPALRDEAAALTVAGDVAPEVKVDGLGV